MNSIINGLNFLILKFELMLESIFETKRMNKEDIAAVEAADAMNGTKDV